MTSGLVAEWHFDGNSQDSSGNGNHGTVYGAKYVDGIKGEALAFDGMDNYFWAPVSDALNSVGAQGTVLAWVNFSDNYLVKESGTTCSRVRARLLSGGSEHIRSVTWFHRLRGQDAVWLESG